MENFQIIFLQIFFSAPTPFSGPQVHIFWTTWKCLTASWLFQSWYCVHFFLILFTLKCFILDSLYYNAFKVTNLSFFVLVFLLANFNIHVISGFHFPTSLHTLYVLIQCYTMYILHCWDPNIFVFLNVFLSFVWGCS